MMYRKQDLFSHMLTVHLEMTVVHSAEIKYHQGIASYPFHYAVFSTLIYLINTRLR